VARHNDPINEAQALIVKGDPDSAVRILADFLNTEFFHPNALFLIGSCLLGKGLNGFAAALLSAAVDARAAKDETFPEAMMNLGSCYKSEHRNEVARQIYLDALKVETLPRERSKILANVSGLYVNEGQAPTAIDWCDQALREDPYNAGAKANRGMACLELGRWREGWEGFYATYASGDRSRRVYVPNGHAKPLPEWEGEAGQTVIVFGDQGVGDEIYFANSLPDMIARCKKVILDCHPRLEKTFAKSFPEVEVHGTRKDLSELEWVPECGAEFAIGLSDLHRFFRNSDKEWCGAPYISAGGIVINATSRPPNWPPQRIGISWTGGVKRTRQELRSVRLAAFQPIIESLPGAQWFSLQYTDNAAREVCEFEEATGLRVAHFPGKVECFDYDETVNFIASMDLVITVCTTVHHVAGALGVPCWTLVPKQASWRYSGIGERLPWYDSVRCFRQTEDGDWCGPVGRIVEELKK